MREKLKFKRDSIIFAPHPDDELIGCFELFEKGKVDSVVYDGRGLLPVRQTEARNFCRMHNCNIILQTSDLNPSMFLDTTKENFDLYFPDPLYEHHPLHREWGNFGVHLLYRGYRVVFYNTTMAAPYLHEVKKAKDKLKSLNVFYPSQKLMWEYERKYCLFEGYCRWEGFK
jgi:hypothetical protein